MCETCGCGDPHVITVPVQEKILAANDERAHRNRELFARAGVTAINLMGSPGAGKTALLEAASGVLGVHRRLGALAGDLATELDAERLRSAGIASRTITTGSACHLDAQLVAHALEHFEGWKGLDYLFIENVGNLVCPAVYDLGQTANVVVLSVTEGEDKPLKYPVVFQRADLVVLTKVDLLPHLTVRQLAFEDALDRVSQAPLISLSAVTGRGVRRFTEWLEGQWMESRNRASEALANARILDSSDGRRSPS